MSVDHLYPKKQTTMYQTVHDAVQYTNCAQRKTVSAMDVVYALKLQGRRLYGFDEKK